MTKKIKILIVDDSVLFRSQIQLALRECPEFEVVATASNGQVAIEKMLSQEIDLCTLDIEMPVLDGIATLKEMKTRNLKTKVIMFSSLTKVGAEKTIEAMRLGAVDFVLKPQLDTSTLKPYEKIQEVLVPKIHSLFGTNTIKETITSLKPTVKSFKTQIVWETFRPEVLVIASSTGGPAALVEYFSTMTEVLPFPILIAQHMPPVFSASLAERIGIACGKVSKEAVHGEILRPNQIYMAPGDYHLKLTGDRSCPTVHLDQGEKRNYVRPCADYLFETAAKIFTRNTLGVVLTGMGRDGADGAAAIKNAGGAVLIQDEASCVVFGMPGAVYESGHYDYSGTPQSLSIKTLNIAHVRRPGHVA